MRVGKGIVTMDGGQDFFLWSGFFAAMCFLAV
jgi:hypothetical protein